MVGGLLGNQPGGKKQGIKKKRRKTTTNKRSNEKEGRHRLGGMNVGRLEILPGDIVMYSFT